MERTLVTVTGPSMSGKTTLLRRLEPLGAFQELVSHTTRPMRSGEINGVDYHFVKPSEFADIEMAELVIYGDYSYGLAVETINKAMEGNKIPIVIVEPNGAAQLLEVAKKRDWNIIRVFINVSPIVQQERFIMRLLNDRNADPEVYKKRFALLRSEWDWETAQNWDLIIPAFDEFSEIAAMDRLLIRLGVLRQDQRSDLR